MTQVVACVSGVGLEVNKAGLRDGCSERWTWSGGCQGQTGLPKMSWNPRGQSRSPVGLSTPSSLQFWRPAIEAALHRHTHFNLELQKEKAENQGGWEELWAQLLPYKDKGSQQIRENMHELWQHLTLYQPSKSRHAYSLPSASKSCLNLPLWQILTQNYTTKGILGNIVPA